FFSWSDRHVRRLLRRLLATGPSQGRRVRIRTDGAPAPLRRGVRRSPGAATVAAAGAGPPGDLPVHARRPVAHGHVRLQAAAPGGSRQDAALRDSPVAEGAGTKPRQAPGVAVFVLAVRE